MNVPSKAPTGSAGFDEITGGGLPRGRTALLVGGPGSRDFDLGGMLAALQAKTREMGARRIVFDGLDVVLALPSDPVAARLETSVA